MITTLSGKLRETKISCEDDQMQVAILAGGLATRLGSLTQDQPKSLVRVLGIPFLQYQLEFLRKGGIENVVLCIGHLGEKIESYFGTGRRFGVNIKYSYEDRLLGTAGALKNAEPFLGDIFFTLYGDSYVFLDFGAAMAYFSSQNRFALMTIYQNHDLYDKSNTAVEAGLVKKYSKKEKTEDMVYIDYGVGLFRKKALEMIPQNEPYSLENVFLSLIEREQLSALEVKERFFEIGSPQGLKAFEMYVRETNDTI